VKTTLYDSVKSANFRFFYVKKCLSLKTTLPSKFKNAIEFDLRAADGSNLRSITE